MTTEDSGTIIVVDDEEVIRYTLQKKLSRQGYNVISLEKAEDVLYLLKNGQKVDLIITDVKLRKMDGIELLRRIHGQERHIPVLIISGHSNVEDAIKALRYGASDFIRKPFDINDVSSSVRLILKRKKEKKFSNDVATYIQNQNITLKIPADTSILNTISYHLTKDLVPIGLCNPTTAENITLALQESLSNAMFHGCLEISSSIREDKGIRAFNEEIEKRRLEPEFKDRVVTLTYKLTPEYVEYTIQDEGKGFDHSNLPDPRDPENFFKNSGRGLLIIQIHMDEVKWNEKGNIIIMKKYKVDRKEE